MIQNRARAVNKELDQWKLKQLSQIDAEMKQMIKYNQTLTAKKRIIDALLSSIPPPDDMQQTADIDDTIDDIVDGIILKSIRTQFDQYKGHFGEYSIHTREYVAIK
eukprot:360068_1